MKRLVFPAVWFALFPPLLFAAPPSARTPAVNYPILADDKVFGGLVANPPCPACYNLDLIGSNEIIGTTWYDNQGIGAAGRRIVRTEDGFTHFVWTNWLDYGSTKLVYYNYVNPDSTQGWPGTGYPVEAGTGGGSPTIDVTNDGAAFIAFHWLSQLYGVYHTAVAHATLPGVPPSGPSEPPLVDGIGVLWPKIQLDQDETIHLIATMNPYSGVASDPQQDYYISGTYDPHAFTINWDPSWSPLDWTMTCASDLATSRVSDRLAVAWTYPMEIGFPYYGDPSQCSNDIYVLIDEDGMNPNFEEAFNLTDFFYPAYNLLPDTLYANADTLRAYTDISLFFDQDDFLHVVFTTPSYFAIQGTRYWHASIVWHWTEQYPDEFVMIHNAFDDFWWNTVDCGAWNMKAQRPSLGQDPNNGYLYCTYQVYDCSTTALSAGGWPSGEVYVSVSTDGGTNWAVGTNVTETITPNNAAPGQCLSEIYPTMADLVDGEVHILYCMDKDAGCVLQTEGTWTLNDMIYHRVPVDLIPTTPLVEQNVPFHVDLAAIYDFYVELTPMGPTSFPAAGGVLDYNLEGGNSGFLFTPLDIWAEVMIPPGGETITVMGPIEDFPMNPGWSANRDRQLTVPGNAPEGNYILYAYIGDYDQDLPTIYAVDQIFFDKSETFDGGGGMDFKDVGESFIDLLSINSQDEPKSPVLHPNSPNPFNLSTSFSFDLPETAHVELKVYNLQGQLIATLIDGPRDAATYYVTFDASKLASGIYLYRFTAGNNVTNGKLVLLK